MSVADSSWSVASWQGKNASQQPDYPDADALDAALATIAAQPPLVTSWEIETLKTHLAEAAHGQRFLLQGGDCAERFHECTADIITARLKVLLQMSLVLVYGLRKPIVRVGRFAGQYAKPRSSPTETRGDVTLPSYRGDIINDIAYTPEARQPDPRRLVKAYGTSALTLNFVRALIDGGFADLHHPEYWELDFARHSPLSSEYEAIVDRIHEALRFAETVADGPISGIRRADFYTSHEALHLHYEQALTRHVPRRDGVYNLSTHFPWIGKRTAHLDGAHVEYMRGIRNPIGLKVGPTLPPSDLQALITRLNPDDEPGRLTLITRLGVDQIEDRLPRLIEAVQALGTTVLWCCDPMHGNTEVTESGLKTRHFDNILGELEQAMAVHQAMGTYLGGVHFELTGEDVTECIGGARGLTEHDLERAYTSVVDPRLNAEQGLEMALRIVRSHQHIQPGRNGSAA
ncbi:MAG: 3-deoxy-7-phosphoheptulonate synthase class II [Bacteroidetes bacterium]|jgi:3-deoxy-7-phosphoheptulonate synthase|nr:3-deoxy-7-phosphoheptulonate synthase class II [Bacteroidota bacterium]